MIETPKLTNDRWMNFPEGNGNGIITIDRTQVVAVQDAYDKSGPVIGVAHVHLTTGNVVAVQVGRHAIITSILMAEQNPDVGFDKPPLAS